nr:lob domain-containing protein 15 [Quercus suber]
MSRERERFDDEVGKRIKRETDASSQMGRRHMLGPPGTLNTITPCAACKLLRRRCAQECPFSPYFSPHEPQKFASVHKVFGASNVSKMLMEVPESQRADAANSLVYEANVRLRDPVYGCMGAISALQQQVQSLQAELNALHLQTAIATVLCLSQLRCQPPKLITLPSKPKVPAWVFINGGSFNFKYTKPTLPSKATSLEEIRKNLSEFHTRSSVPPSTIQPNSAHSSQNISFQELYKRNVTAKDPLSSSFSRPSKATSLEEIRKNLSEFHTQSSVPPSTIQPNSAHSSQNISFQELYKRNVTANADENATPNNTESGLGKLGGGGTSRNLSFEAIRESLRQIHLKTEPPQNQRRSGDPMTLSAFKE